MQGAHDVVFPNLKGPETSPLLSGINFSALAARASSLRNGVKCRILEPNSDPGRRTDARYHYANIRFYDSITWLARFRKFIATHQPRDILDYLVQSEVMTLRWLETKAIRSPKVYGYALESDSNNDVGAGYILMEKLPGRRFTTTPREYMHQWKKVIKQLAGVYVELSFQPFSRMGSLLADCGRVGLGPIAEEFPADYSGSNPILLGPYRSARENFISRIRQNMKLLVREEIGNERAVGCYLVQRFLLDMVPRVVREPVVGHQFFLKHANDHGDHILVDDEYNITGIIDWECAYTAPWDSAFNSPMMLLVQSDDFPKGAQRLGELEEDFARYLERRHGGQRLAVAVRTGRAHHFFALCCDFDMPRHWEEFLGLFRGLRDAVGVDDGMEWDPWMKAALHRYRNDIDLLKLKAAEDK